jgi:outer membrane protein assembly factor BamD
VAPAHIRLHKIPWLIVCLVLLVLIPACSKHKQEKTAEQLVEEGRTNFEKKNYQDAIEAYEKLKDWYPFSVHAKEAELKVADAHYKLKEYEQAIAAYKEFSQLHPSDPQAAYVLYQIGKCYYDQIETPDRDQTYTLNAIEAFRNLILAFPESDYAKQAQTQIDECLKLLAENDLYVGKFYFRSKHYKAAMDRFLSVVKNYPDFGLQQEARDYMEKCQIKIDQMEEKKP